MTAPTRRTRLVPLLLMPFAVAAVVLVLPSTSAGVDASAHATLPATTAVDGVADVGDPVMAVPVLGSMHDDVVLYQGEAGAEQLEQQGSLDEAAAYVDMEPEELAVELEHDDLMFVTDSLLTGFVQPPIADEAVAALAAETPAATNYQGDVFALSSRPSSPRTIFLDFDGHTTTGTHWNSNFSLPTIVSTPYDYYSWSVASTPGVFTDLERSNMHQIWQMVADDFAAFDVNVTTIDPGAAGLSRTSSSDTTFGTRVVITASNWYYRLYGSAIGGIAYVNLFSSNSDLPAFVFSNQTAGGNPYHTASTTSHETGHMLGLLHDGQTNVNGPTTEYYGGNGLWTPIMGGGTGRFTQWSKGEYPRANRTQDDVAQIASYTGLISDDYPATSALAPTVAAQSSFRGRLTVRDDVDTFNVFVGAGTFTAEVKPPVGSSGYSSLYASVTVRNSAGAVVLAASPDNTGDWMSRASGILPAGWYSVQIAPAGYLTATTGGFSSYGSLGVYQVTLDGPSAAPTQTTAPPAPPPSTTPLTLPPPPDPGSRFTALTPARLADTRSGLGGSARLDAGGVLRLQVTGRGGVPAGATSAVLNVVAVNPSAAGFLTVHPCSAVVPDVSVLNFAGGQTVANSTIATLNATGEVCVFAQAASDVIVDVTGWLGSAGASRLTQIGPLRVADTRSGLGRSWRLAAGATATFDLRGFLPSGSTAVALNLTAVEPSAGGFLTAYPCDEGRPETSSLNFGGGETRPNNGIVAVSRGGLLCVYAQVAADVIVDLTGALGPTGLSYVPTDPERLVDTRPRVPVGAGGTVMYGLRTRALGDMTPIAASVNVAVADHPGDGFTTSFDCQTLRDTSTLNQVAGSVSANGAIVPVSDAMASCVYSQTGGNVIVDLNGWWIR